MRMMSEFKEFAMRGNVIDLAVGVVIGGAFGKIVTALVDNEVGRLIENMILAGGVDARHIVWRDSDGIGRTVRNGLNFTERGFGVRGAVGEPQHRPEEGPGALRAGQGRR